MDKDYFQSDEFKELLKSYEAKKERGIAAWLDADAYADIADYYIEVDRPHCAARAVEEGLQLYQGDEVLLAVKSAVHIYLHEYDAAEHTLRSLDPDDSDVKYMLAQIEYAKYMHVKKAETMWRAWMRQEEAQQKLSEQLQRENYIHIISSMTELCDSEKNWKEKGEEAVRRWVKEYIDKFQPLGTYTEDVQLADICRENELTDLLCEVLSQVLMEQPYLPKGWSNLAVAQHLEHDYEQALESCNFALAINPNDMETLLTKAHSLHAMGEKGASIPVFEEYLNKGGDVVQMIPYADALFEDNEHKNAIEKLQWLVHHYNNKLKEMEADLQETNKKGETSEHDTPEQVEAQTRMETFREQYRNVMYDIANLFHQNGYFELSILINKKIVTLFPNDAEALFLTGTNLLALRKFEEASQCLSHALICANDQVEMGVNIALSFVLNNFDNFAIDVLDSVEQIAANSPSPFVKNISAAKAITFLKMGQKKPFIQSFKTACAECPDLVESLFRGYFPEGLPIDSWGDFAENNMKKLMRTIKIESMRLQKPS